MEGKEEDIRCGWTATPILSVFQEVFIVDDFMADEVRLQSLSCVGNLIDGVFCRRELDQSKDGRAEAFIVLVEGVDFGVVSKEGEELNAKDTVDEESDNNEK